MTNVALLVAAGRGTRLGAAVPKQYLPLGGRPVLAHAIAAFARHPEVSAVRVVIQPEDRERYDAAAAGFAVLEPVSGGASRQESVCLGLESLAALAPARVLIHDAARPFVAPHLISRVLAMLDMAPGAIAALPLADSLKRGHAGTEGAAFVAGDVAREDLWRAQTPQAFRFPEILAAHRAARGQDLSDDAAVATSAGLAVRLVAGEAETFKITTAEDLAEAERRLLGRLGDIRVGTGFDVHAFAPAADTAADSAVDSDRRLMLCGVAIPGERALAGHSDADVALHALTDALLGAIGAADIGAHFPPSDPAFRSAASAGFLRHAVDLVRAQGGMIAHLDLTLICERPKIAPHREAMRAAVAEIAGLAPERVSIKATTTERLGFTGRGEGIAAQAVATVRLP